MAHYKQDDELDTILGYSKSWVLWIVGLLVALSLGGWFLTRSEKAVDTGLVRYQEFQEMYNTTAALNNNLCNLKKVDDKDAMFKDFSKAQQTLAIQNQLNRWISEYNAKSNLINFNVWKSATLPHTLNQAQFNCAN